MVGPMIRRIRHGLCVARSIGFSYRAARWISADDIVRLHAEVRLAAVYDMELMRRSGR